MISIRTRTVTLRLEAKPASAVRLKFFARAGFSQ
jgi:hypothetical protein